MTPVPARLHCHCLSLGPKSGPPSLGPQVWAPKSGPWGQVRIDVALSLHGRFQQGFVWAKSRGELSVNVGVFAGHEAGRNPEIRSRRVLSKATANLIAARQNRMVDGLAAPRPIGKPRAPVVRCQPPSRVDHFPARAAKNCRQQVSAAGGSCLTEASRRSPA